MSLKGDLSTVGLAEVFQMISMSQKQGTLLVQDGESRKAIYFGKEGVSLLSTGKRKGFRIGDILCRFGKITAVQLDEVLQRQRESHRMLGEELVASGMVTEVDIQEVVRSQIEEEIYDLFLWKRAAFEFIEGDPVEELQDPESKAIKLAFDLNGLLLEAVRRTDEWTRINQKIPSLEFIYTFVSSEAQLQESQSQNERIRIVARSIDGTATVTDIVDQTLMPRFDICNILVDLMDRGRIRQLDVGEVVQVAKRRLEEGKRERGLALFQVAVLQAPEDVELLDSYAHALETEGLTHDAARSYLRVGNLLKGKGQAKDSIGYFQRALALLPNDPQSKEALFEINMAGGNIEEALQAALDIITGGLKTKDFTAARSVGEKAVAAAPQNLEVRLGLARVYHALSMKPERDEMVRFITKNLPVDQAAADRILIDLREISDITAAAKTQKGPAPRHKKPSSSGKMTIVAAVLLVGVIGAGVFYEMKAKRVYEGIANQARALEDGAQLVQARDILAGFEATIWRFSLTTKGRYRSDLAALDKKLGEASANPSPSASAVAVEDPVARAEREKREQLEKDKKEAADLEDWINAEKTRGQMEKAADYAKRLLDLATKLGDTRRQKFAEAADRDINVYLSGALNLTVEYQELERKGLFIKACEKIAELLRNYPYSEKARTATYPLALRVHPNGVSVIRDGKAIGESKGEDIVVRLAAEEKPFQLQFKKPGFKSQQIDIASPKEGARDVTLDEKEWAWTLPIGSELDTALHLDGELIYVRTREAIMALTADKRIQRWSENKLPGSGLPIRVRNDRLYVVSGKSVMILDPRVETKNVVDRIDLDETVVGTPGFSADGSTMHVGIANGTLVSVDLVKKTRSVRKMPKDVRAEPIERNGQLYVACTDGTLYVYKGADEVWKASTGSPIVAAPIFGDDGTIYVGAEDGKVYALLDKGLSKWTSVALGGPIETSLVFGGKLIYACSENGTLHALEAATGVEKWKYATGGPIHGAPVATAEAVFFGSDDNWLYAVKADTGELLWRCRTSKPIRTAPALKDGMVYFGSDDQILYGVKVD